MHNAGRVATERRKGQATRFVESAQVFGVRDGPWAAERELSLGTSGAM
jgi:hypothetical protein